MSQRIKRCPATNLDAISYQSRNARVPIMRRRSLLFGQKKRIFYFPRIVTAMTSYTGSKGERNFIQRFSRHLFFFFRASLVQQRAANLLALFPAALQEGEGCLWRLDNVCRKEALSTWKKENSNRCAEESAEKPFSSWKNVFAEAASCGINTYWYKGGSSSYPSPAINHEL